MKIPWKHKDMIDVNTIVGDALNSPDGTTIVPISKVSFGFASGGSEYLSEKQNENDLNYPLVVVLERVLL